MNDQGSWDESFDQDRGEALERARNKRVSGVLAVGETLEEAKRIFKAQKRTEAGVCAPASGLYLMEVFY